MFFSETETTSGQCQSSQNMTIVIIFLSPVMAEDLSMMLIIIEYDGHIVFPCDNHFVPSDGRRLPYDADEQPSCPG